MLLWLLLNKTSSKYRQMCRVHFLTDNKSSSAFYHLPPYEPIGHKTLLIRSMALVIRSGRRSFGLELRSQKALIVNNINSLSFYVMSFYKKLKV